MSRESLLGSGQETTAPIQEGVGMEGAVGCAVWEVREEVD